MYWLSILVQLDSDVARFFDGRDKPSHWLPLTEITNFKNVTTIY